MPLLRYIKYICSMSGRKTSVLHIFLLIDVIQYI